MLTEKYDFRITDQMTIPLRPHWIANDSYREKCKMLVLNRSKGEIHKVDFSKLTDYIKEGDVICFNDSTIINHMFICKTRQNRLISGFQKQASLVFENQAPAFRLCDCLPGLKQTVNHQNGWLRNTHVPHTENGGQQEKPRYVAS